MTGCGILWKRSGIRGGRPNFSADENLYIELFSGAFFGYNEKRVNAHGGGKDVCTIFSGEDSAGANGCQNHALCPGISILPERRRIVPAERQP